MSQMNFLGFLMNVDSSISKVNFGHGISVRAMPIDDAYQLLSKLDNFKDYGIFVQETVEVWSNDKEFYVLTGEFEADNTPPGTMEFHNKVLDPLLDIFLPKLRLFKEGNIQLPLFYVYSEQDGTVARRERGGFAKSAHGPKFHVEKSEVEQLEMFINSFELPFAEQYIDLAFQSYDKSYGWLHPNLSFLLLMIGLESLFNQSGSEITYKVSRYSAVLLGNTVEECRSIFAEVRSLYGLRSKIIHGTPGLVVKDEDVSTLRSLLRDSIKKISVAKSSKHDLLEELDARGYGGKSLPADVQ